jgi:hypothetical protein
MEYEHTSELSLTFEAMRKAQHRAARRPRRDERSEALLGYNIMDHF